MTLCGRSLSAIRPANNEIYLIETLKRWHNNAPAPVIWLLAMLILYSWLLLLSFVFSFLAGGMERVSTNWPGYALRTGEKILYMYALVVGLYLIYRLIVALARRSSGNDR